MVDPISTPTMKPLLAKFGVEWQPKRTILERNPLQQLAGGNPLTPIVMSYNASHEITQDMKQLTVFPFATPVDKMATTPPGLTVTSLFSSSGKSSEVAIQGDKIDVDKAPVRAGPISLAVAVSGKVETPAPPKDPKAPNDIKDQKKDEKDIRLVVVGNSGFVTNSARKLFTNADLFQNMLSWLAHEEDLIAIRPRPADSSSFEITATRMRVINLASMVVSPLLMFAVGIAVWLTRKRM